MRTKIFKQSLGGGGGVLGASQYGLTVPTVAGLGLSTKYGSSATYTQTDTALGVNFADSVNNGANYTGSLMAYPGTAFTYTAALTITPNSVMSVSFGPAASASGAGEWLTQHSSGGLAPSPSIDIEDWFSPSSYSGTIEGTEKIYTAGAYLWFRYQDDGTNITYSTSTEGINWFTVYTVAKTDGFLASNGGYNFFGVTITTYNGPGGTIMLGQKMTTP
jgi:hypothetical protein